MPDGDSTSTQNHGTVAWKYRDFRLYSVARLLGVMGGEAQAVAVAWQIYEISRHAGMSVGDSALRLGYTGLALFLPGIFFVLIAGHTADRYDKRTVVLCCYTGQAIATGLLLHISLNHTQNVWLIYAILFMIGTGRCFSGPAMSALLPTIVPKEHFVNAVTWGATIFQIANSSGPMIGGFLFTIPLPLELIHFDGAPIVYAFTLTMLLCYIAIFTFIKPTGSAEKKGFTIQTMLAGLKYVARTRLLLGSISLDLFAVLLGGAVSLLPIFAADILHSGSRGLGILRAMPSLGALIVSLSLLLFPLKRRAGRTMLICVGLFGAATVVFGISKIFWISCVALFITGAVDMISVVVRSSILQLATPPEMRGRVSSVNWLFLGASNEFGEYESGLTAHWWGAVRAVIIGGFASMAITGLWSVFFPALREADELTAESLIAVENRFASQEENESKY